MNTRRSFFKSLATLGAAAVGCPGIFIPKFEPVKWKKLAGINENFQIDPREFFGKWQFVTTTYRLNGDIWTPDDKVNFAPYPKGSTDMPLAGVVKFEAVPILV